MRLWANGIVISMFALHNSDRGSNPGRDGEFHNDNIMINITLRCLASTQRVIILRSANRYQFNYWDQIVETQGKGVNPSTIW